MTIKKFTQNCRKVCIERYIMVYICEGNTTHYLRILFIAFIIISASINLSYPLLTKNKNVYSKY